MYRWIETHKKSADVCMYIYITRFVNPRIWQKCESNRAILTAGLTNGQGSHLNGNCSLILKYHLLIRKRLIEKIHEKD